MCSVNYNGWFVVVTMIAQPRKHDHILPNCLMLKSDLRGARLGIQCGVACPNHVA
jgi:hypothetical protein